MDPKEIVMKMLPQNIPPFYANLINLANQGKDDEIKKIGRNAFGDIFENSLNDLKSNPFKFLKF